VDYILLSKGVLYMDVNTSIVIGVAFVFTLSIFYVTAQEIFKFKLKKEQIKADVLIRTEEIKAKNQLDIEQLIMQDKIGMTQSVDYAKTNSNQDQEFSERRNRLNERM
jgi:hypothetical protein